MASIWVGIFLSRKTKTLADSSPCLHNTHYFELNHFFLHYFLHFYIILHYFALFFWIPCIPCALQNEHVEGFYFT